MDKQSLLSSSSQAFDAAPVVTTTTKPTLTGIKRQVPIFTAPQGISDKDRGMMLAALTMCAKSTTERVKPWQTWIATYLSVAFEGFTGKIAGEGADEYITQELPTTFVKSISDAIANPNDLVTSPKLITFPKELPQGSTLFTAELYNSGTIEGVYGYLSLIVFLMGKRITERNREAIEKKRPENIISAWKIGNASYILTGKGQIGRKASEMIPHAWNQSPLLRDVVVREFTTFAGSRIHSLEVAGTLFHLLEHAGMQAAVFCHRLLTACDWVMEIPLLKPDLSVYAKSVEEYLNMPEEHRPYVKLLKGSATKIFHTKSMGRLVGCAVLWLSQDEPSIAQYNAPGAEEAKRVFIAEAKKRGITIRAAPSIGQVLAPAGAAPQSVSTT